MMTKENIIDHLTFKCGLRRSSAITAVNGMLEQVSFALSKGEDVSLRPLGILRVKDVPARQARNMQTNEPMTVPAHKSVKLVLSKELKEKLNNKEA